MQDILHVIFLASGSVVSLFFLTKIMGYRQLSELSMFDYINGITIGSIAAEMATSLENSFIMPLTAMIVYTVFSVILSFISTKSYFARGIIAGKPIILINKGEIFEDNLKKSKIDLSELLIQCRVNGYFDISKIETAVLEGNGKISFLPKSSNRPVTPNDLGLNPKQEFLVANLIIDGNIMEENLKHCGKDFKWLNSMLNSKGIKNVEEVILATCDTENNFTVFKRTNCSKENESYLIH